MHNLPRHAGVLMRLVIFVAGACLSAGAAAQAPPQGPVPLQKEGATVSSSNIPPGISRVASRLPS